MLNFWLVNHSQFSQANSWSSVTRNSAQLWCEIKHKQPTYGSGTPGYVNNLINLKKAWHYVYAAQMSYAHCTHDVIWAMKLLSLARVFLVPYSFSEALKLYAKNHNRRD